MLSRLYDMDPTFAFMDQLRRRMDQVFEDRGVFSNLSEDLDGWGAPRVTLHDAGNAFVLRAELPGMSDKDITLSLHQDVLTLSGERKRDLPEGYFVHRAERAQVKFSKSFSLPGKVDPERTGAVMKDGVLTITLEKAKEAQPQRIQVRAS